MSEGLIAILRGIQPHEAAEIALTLVEAGFGKIEVPLNSPDPISSISAMVKAVGDAALIGAGTVLTTEDVQRVKDVGGKLIVSPNCDPEIIEATKKQGLLSYPGVLTPTECFTAVKAGADGLKLYPAHIAGIEGLKAVRAVLPPDTKILPVGGVGPSDFAEWVKAGAAGFGIGSALYKPGRSVSDISAVAQEMAKAYKEATDA